MINIKLQDFTATIHRTSRDNGGQYDLIHVECLIVSDQPIPASEIWYIPNARPIDPTFKIVFEQNNIAVVPIHGSIMDEKIKSTLDILQQAQSENQQETKADIIALAQISCMTKTTLKVLEGTANNYILSYDYKLFPVTPNTFELKVTLPFPGFTIPDNGDEIQLTFVAPIGAIIDETLTKGVDDQNVDILPQIAKPTNTRKQIVSFGYRKDPKFTIRYHY